MDPATYQYQSDFAKRYVAQGEVKGRAVLVAKQLTLRFGPLPESTHTEINSASLAELDTIGERLLTAKTLEEALELR